MKAGESEIKLELQCSCGTLIPLSFEQLLDPGIKKECPGCGKRLELQEYLRHSLPGDKLETSIRGASGPRIVDYGNGSTAREPGKNDPRTLQERILHAHRFIAERVQKEAKDLISRLEWNERKNDWEADMHYLIAYICDQRFSLPFTLQELIQDQGSMTWERVVMDKINWFLEKLSVKVKPGSVLPFSLSRKRGEKAEESKRLRAAARLLRPGLCLLAFLLFTLIFFLAQGLHVIWLGALSLLPVLTVALLYGFWPGLASNLIFLPITGLYIYLKLGHLVVDDSLLLMGPGLNVAISALLGSMRDLMKKYRDLYNWRKAVVRFFPICVSCGKVQVSHNNWMELSDYFKQHPGSQPAEGLCPQCLVKLNKNKSRGAS